MYSLSIVGGTFDHFHKGHQLLLDEAIASSKKVIIGVARKKLYQNKQFSTSIQEYEIRVEKLKYYIDKKRATDKVQIQAIDDIFGPSLEIKFIDAIFVTENTIESVELINKRRLEKGFPGIKVINVPLVRSADDKIISSERIRKGEIDRDGRVYTSYFTESTLVLPGSLRTQLRTPIGDVVKNIGKTLERLATSSLVITVGDIVSLSLAELNHQSAISVIDFKTQRHELEKKKEKIFQYFSSPNYVCTNKAGFIESEAALVLNTSMEEYFRTGKKQIIHIKGEEDLLALPAILFAPLNAVVMYGQYDQGAVLVEVTEQKKQEVLKLIRKFNS